MANNVCIDFEKIKKDPAFILTSHSEIGVWFSLLRKLIDDKSKDGRIGDFAYHISKPDYELAVRAGLIERDELFGDTLHGYEYIKIKNTPNGCITSAFESFWNAYPRKVSKATALKAWPGDDKLGLILEALKWQKEIWASKKIDFVPHPATYLNQKRWEDEKPSVIVAANKSNPVKEPVFIPKEKKQFTEEAIREAKEMVRRIKTCSQ